jgi:hypothetical protein
MSDITKCFDFAALAGNVSTFQQHLNTLKRSGSSFGAHVTNIAQDDLLLQEFTQIAARLENITDEQAKCALSPDVCTNTSILGSLDRYASPQVLNSINTVLDKYSPVLKRMYLLMIHYLTIYNTQCQQDPERIEKVKNIITKIAEITDFLQKTHVCGVSPACPTCSACTCEETDVSSYSWWISGMGIVICILVFVIIYLISSKKPF